MPALAMIFVVKLIEFPVTKHYFADSFWLYIGSLIVFDAMLAVLLAKYHQSMKFRIFFRVNSSVVRGGIPQVNAIVLVLLLSLIQELCVTVEVALYKGGIISAESLFLYPNYQPVKIMFKVLELTAIWAMLIDSAFAEEHKAVKLLKKLKSR